MKKQHPIPRTLFRAVVSSLLLAAASASSVTVALAQSESDLKTIDKVRALYSTGPVPGSISCGAVVDWEGFFDRMKIERTDDVKARLQALKSMKISVSSQDANHTQVTTDTTDPSYKTLTDGLGQQLQGFFQMYWSEAYGRLIPKRGDKFELTTMPGGYSVKMNTGLMKVSMDMDKAYLITTFGIESPQLSAVIKPGSKPGDDGLLRLRNIDETIDMGASKIVVSVGFDYQKVEGSDVPQHINISVPGSYSFDYTLTGCEVNATKPAVTIFPPPAHP
jgi:hypothetical protein